MSQWYKNHIVVPCEEIFEIVTDTDGLGWGLAVARIVESRPHVHEKTKETYTLISGVLKVHLWPPDIDALPKIILLAEPGQSVAIPANVTHWAESPDENRGAMVLVLSIPAWNKEDHILIDSAF